MTTSYIKDNMRSLGIILREIDHLQEYEVFMLLHILIDRIHPPLERSTKVNANPFHKYRGKAKGVWTQDAQAYINELRNADRF